MRVQNDLDETKIILVSGLLTVANLDTCETELSVDIVLNYCWGNTLTCPYFRGFLRLLADRCII
jgi:hypothetical protein